MRYYVLFYAPTLREFRLLKQSGELGGRPLEECQGWVTQWIATHWRAFIVDEERYNRWWREYLENV